MAGAFAFSDHVSDNPHLEERVFHFVFVASDDVPLSGQPYHGTCHGACGHGAVLHRVLSAADGGYRILVGLVEVQPQPLKVQVMCGNDIVYSHADHLLVLALRKDVPYGEGHFLSVVGVTFSDL